MSEGMYGMEEVVVRRYDRLTEDVLSYPLGDDDRDVIYGQILSKTFDGDHPTGFCPRYVHTLTAGIDRWQDQHSFPDFSVSDVLPNVDPGYASVYGRVLSFFEDTGVVNATIDNSQKTKYARDISPGMLEQMRIASNLDFLYRFDEFLQHNAHRTQDIVQQVEQQDYGLQRNTDVIRSRNNGRATYFCTDSDGPEQSLLEQYLEQQQNTSVIGSAAATSD